jgi:hypothetical protein
MLAYQVPVYCVFLIDKQSVEVYSLREETATANPINIARNLPSLNGSGK